MKTIWLTDLHLDHLSEGDIKDFLTILGAQEFDAVLISGDIARAGCVCARLEEIASAVKRPVYFVLGNHDYYDGSILQVRAAVNDICRQSPYLNRLSSCSQSIALGPDTHLIGHDGWGDARLGKIETTDVTLWDFKLIKELHGLKWPGIKPSEIQALNKKLNFLGDAAARHIRHVLPGALEKASHIVVLTHVPPFRESTWHEGKISDDNWLPYFSCKAVGDVLFEFMSQYPEKQMTVLCGHTHSPGEGNILPNLKVMAGKALYGKPELQSVLEF